MKNTRLHPMRILALAALLLLALAPAALAARTYRTWEDAGVKLYSPREKD